MGHFGRQVAYLISTPEVLPPPIVLTSFQGRGAFPFATLRTLYQPIPTNILHFPPPLRQNGSRSARTQEGASFYSIKQRPGNRCRLAVASIVLCGTFFTCLSSPASNVAGLLPSWPLTNISCQQYLDKRLFVQLNGSRKVLGVLRGYDVFLNIVLDEAVEEKDGGEKVKLGMVVRL